MHPLRTAILPLLMLALSVPIARAETAATAPATQAATIDVQNTECLVMSDDSVDPGPDGPSAVYQGKRYHFCCRNCVSEFNKNPEKYIKAFEANPAKYGIK